MSLLPPNASALEHALEEAASRISGVPVPIATLLDPKRCPGAALPFLAWALSIDDWSSGWTDAQKRARVAQAIAIQRRKGTAQAIRDIIGAAGGNVSIIEWWQRTPPAAPHTFTVAIAPPRDGDGAPVSVDALIVDIERTKPVRAHFDVQQLIAGEARVGVVAGARPALFVRLALAAPPA